MPGELTALFLIKEHLSAPAWLVMDHIAEAPVPMNPKPYRGGIRITCMSQT
jgi:hypothetical protein